MEENMMLIVSDETHDMTTADSVRPSSENTHTTVRSGEMVATGVIGRAWARGVIGRVLARVLDISYLCVSLIWRRCANVLSADTGDIFCAYRRQQLPKY